MSTLIRDIVHSMYITAARAAEKQTLVLVRKDKVGAVVVSTCAPDAKETSDPTVQFSVEIKDMPYQEAEIIRLVTKMLDHKEVPVPTNKPSLDQRRTEKLKTEVVRLEAICTEEARLIIENRALRAEVQDLRARLANYEF